MTRFHSSTASESQHNHILAILCAWLIVGGIFVVLGNVFASGF